MTKFTGHSDLLNNSKISSASILILRVEAFFNLSQMKSIKFLSIIALAFSLYACGGDDDSTDQPDDQSIIPETGFTSPTSYPNMTLVWEENFDGTSLNTSNWTYELGTGANGWGNNELQYYRTENTTVRDGHLIIEAKLESFEGSSYTSSRIVSEAKQEFQYGRIDIRAALPEGQGMWPALWMLGDNFRSAGWPGSGEIDIMEMVGGSGRENTVHGTVHWLNSGQHAQFGGQTSLSSGTFHDEFHVFSIRWTENSIRWYVDNNEYHVIDTSPAELDEFRNSFFFIINLAVGGNWPGSPNTSTSFPQYLIVDYIRVFQ